MTTDEMICTAKKEMKKISQMANQTMFCSQEEDLFWRAAGIGDIDYSKDHVQTSQRNMIEESMIALIDLQSRLAIQHKYIAEIRSRMTKCTKGEILVYRYTCKTKKAKPLGWKEIARLTNRSEAQVHRDHNTALEDYFIKWIKE